MKIKLIDIAHGRSGDKGDAANIGIIAYDDKCYEIIKKHLTAEKVKKHFAGICKGKVDRYELPNIRALNFMLLPKGRLVSVSANTNKILK